MCPSQQNSRCLLQYKFFMHFFLHFSFIHKASILIWLKAPLMLWEECNLLAVFGDKEATSPPPPPPPPPRTRECLHLRQNQEVYACERNTYKTLRHGPIQENNTTGKAFRGGGGIASEKNTDWLSIPSWCRCWAPAHAIFWLTILIMFVSQILRLAKSWPTVTTSWLAAVVSERLGIPSMNQDLHPFWFQIPNSCCSIPIILTKGVKKDNSWFKSFIYS